jgi:hypothetical protein
MIAIVRITSLTVMRRILPWFFGHFSPALAAGAALIETTGPRAHLPAPRFLPVVLLLTWAVALYLTSIETRDQRLDKMHTLWWMLLVFLTHFLGYLATPWLGLLPSAAREA